MFKQNGVNVALDSLLNAAVHSIGAALLVIVADDVDSSGSTALQDSRDLAEVLRVPLIEPSMDGDLTECLAAAVELSEAEAVPVIVRLTGPVPQGAAGPARPAAARADEPPRARPPVVNRRVAQGLTKLGRVQHRRLTVAARSDLLPAPAPRMRCRAEHRLGIVAFGKASRLGGQAPACRLELRSTENVERQVREFLAGHDRTLVVEEPLPHLEKRLRADAGPGRVIGRLTGHLPPEGALCDTDIGDALFGAPHRWTGISAKSPHGSTYPPYHDVFSAIADQRRDGTFVATDVGSSVNLCYPPYEASDVAVSLGSAISVAGGAARAGRPTIAVIGDYALMHSGLQSLLDVSLRHTPVLVIVLVNGVQDKTGRQPLAPGLTHRQDVNSAVERIVHGVGPDVHLSSWTATDSGPEGHRRRIEHLLRLAPAVALVADSSLDP
jgi:indolepyruvate ferredoxin oxidoreductase alpha subunit